MRLTALALIMIVTMVIAAAGPAAAQANLDKLMNPAQLNETAPDKFQVKFDTSKGEFIVEVTRAWAPIGADRFYNLVKNGYYDNCRFYRVVENFMAQFGVSGNPKLNAIWSVLPLKDDPVKQSNTRGYITYAKTQAPNSRSTQLFISFSNNSFLDSQGFAPFGKVIKGMNVVDSLNKEYGDKPTNLQGQIRAEGNAFLEKNFPNLDFIKSATLVPADAK